VSFATTAQKSTQHVRMYRDDPINCAVTDTQVPSGEDMLAAYVCRAAKLNQAIALDEELIQMYGKADSKTTMCKYSAYNTHLLIS
jgi:hypothetical protein